MLTRLGILFFIFGFILFHCSCQNDIEFNSSIDLGDYQVDTSRFYGLDINDSIRLKPKPNGVLHAIDRNKNSNSHYQIDELRYCQFFSIQKLNDTIILCLKSPIFADGTHENLFIEFDWRKGKVVKSYSFHDRRLINNNKFLVRQDSACSITPLMGNVLMNNKLYFITVRYSFPTDSLYFSTKIPSVAYWRYGSDSIITLQGVTPPKPKKYNNLLDTDLGIAQLIEGHDNHIVVYFSYTDIVYLINTADNSIKMMSAKVMDMETKHGESMAEINENLSKGINTKRNTYFYRNLVFDPFKQEYWRFAQIYYDSMTPLQINYPLIAYSVFDINFKRKAQGILPKVLSTDFYFKNDEMYASPNRLLKEFSISKSTFKISLNFDPQKSENILKEHLRLGRCEDCSGWSSYVKNHLKFSDDTVRLIVVPSNSCPSCLMGIFNNQKGVDAMRKYNYKFLLLSPYDVFETVKSTSRITSLVPVIHDEYKFLDYLLPMYNPHIVVVSGGKLLVEEYLDPSESEVLEKEIIDAESHFN